jgi:hypothetical protein
MADPDAELASHERGWLGLLLPVILGSACAAALLHGLRVLSDTNFEQAALGTETHAYFAKLDGHLIHGESAESVDLVLKGFAARGGQSAILWLGNSQLHGINDYQAGQQSAPERLSHRLRGEGIEVLAFSPPNANLQEHLVIFEHLRQRLPLKMLLLPVVYDDMRETGVRDGLAPLLQDAKTGESLRQTEIGRTLLATTKPTEEPDDELAALHSTVQERVERALNNWLEAHSELWRTRPQARSAFYVKLLEARNFVFSITSSSVRQMIPSRYATNRQALEAVLSSARQAKIDVLLYVPPVRQDVGIPYHPDQYRKFKQDLADIAERHGTSLVDLDALVPGQQWGEFVYDSLLRGRVREYDFMHFKVSGHDLLADAMSEIIATRTSAAER